VAAQSFFISRPCRPLLSFFSFFPFTVLVCICDVPDGQRTPFLPAPCIPPSLSIGFYWVGASLVFIEDYSRNERFPKLGRDGKGLWSSRRSADLNHSSPLSFQDRFTKFATSLGFLFFFPSSLVSLSRFGVVLLLDLLNHLMSFSIASPPHVDYSFSSLEG